MLAGISSSQYRLFVPQDSHLVSSTRSISAEDSSSTSLHTLITTLCHRHDVDRDAIEAHALKQILGISINIQLTRFGVLCEVESGDLGDVLILSFTFLFLQFEGDASDGTALDALHQVGGVAGDLEDS